MHFFFPIWCALASLLALTPAIILGTPMIIVCAFLSVVMFMVTLVYIYRQHAEAEHMMKRAERQKRALALSEEKYRLLAENADVVVMSYNLRDYAVEVSENYFKYFPGRIAFDQPENFPYLHPDDRAALAEKQHTGVRARSWDVEARMKVRTGEYCWFHVIARELLGDDGQPERIICRLDNIDDQKRHLDMLSLRAQIDGVTGLYCKAATEKLVVQALKEMREGMAALLLVDLDDLKTINDTLGHLEGDRAILTVARTLKARFRNSDIIGRVGGDEFMVFLQGLKSEEWAKGLAGLITEKIGSQRLGCNNDYPLSVSVGIAITDGQNASFESLYREADAALYKVKRGNKNGYAVFGGSENDTTLNA